MTTSFRLPPLVADGGELRLARRVASFVYGRREVEWPEDVDDPEELLPDGREFGWVAKLEDSEPGLSERRFVRADVKINAAEGYSDVEQALDDSALRAGGDVYFESVIEEDGLGLLVPGVDFRQGDLVDVRFWGRILKDQLVTSIDWVDGKPSVALGGQSIRDTGELARARAEMVRLINGERADRVDDVSKVSKRVDTVDGKAQSAQASADEAKQATEDNREYIDEQLDAAGVAVELGRQYLESMQRHVAAGVSSGALATQFAAEAGEFARQALAVLEHLDPLRDDVIDLHEQVRLLGEQAAQAAAKAAQHVTVAASHVTAAQAAADAADGYAAAGQQHVNDAEAAAGRAADSVVAGEALLVQGQAAVVEAAGFAADTAALVGQADGILADTVTARDGAQQAVDDARGLLESVPGDGRSVATILAQVVTLHQSTLEAHSDVLDTHADVLAKHGEAITAAADAAQKAGEASGFALDAAQQALNASSEASAAAQSAGFAADDAIQTGASAAEAARQAGIAASEASEAARLNSDAIQKLADADAKLVAADEKLQQQIDVLEESQRLLAQAVQALAAGVAQSSMASQSALLASDEAGKAAGSALDAVDALADAIDARDESVQAFMDTQAAINNMQDDFMNELADQQLKMKEELARLTAGSTTRVIATAGGSSHPNYPVVSRPGDRWGLQLSGTSGVVMLVDWWKIAGENRTNQISKQAFPTTNNFVLDAAPDEIMTAEWAPIPGIVRSINDTWTGTLSLGSESTWYRSGATPEILIGSSGTTDFDMSVSIRWRAAWGWYRTQIRAGTTVLADVTVRGSSTIFQAIAKTATLHVSNATIPPNTNVEVWSQRWENTSLGGHHQYDRLVTRASWTEKQ